MNWLRTTGLRILLAIGLGFALWGYVSYRENPDLTAPYENIPVDVEGLAPGLVLVDQNGLPRTSRPTIDVTVQAAEATLRTVRASDLRAFVDLAGLPDGEHVVPVNVAATRPGLARLSFTVDPPLLPFRIEQEITRTVPLTVEVSGTVPFSYERLAAQLAAGNQPIQQASVRGPQSRVERVAMARATANIDRLTANYSSPRPAEPISADGQVIAGVTVSPPSVNVLVPIVSSAGIKRVPVVPQVVGQPASGYVVTGVSVEPAFVRLTGSSGPLDQVQSVGTQPLDLAGASGVVSRTVELVEPAGARLQAGEPTSVVVTVRTAPINRPFSVTLPVTVIPVGQPPGTLLAVSPQVVQATFSGPAAQLDALTGTTIQGTVNLRGLDPGSYTLAPAFALPQGVSLTNDPRVTVTLRLAPTPEPTAEEAAPTAAPPSGGPPTATPAPPAPPTSAPTATAGPPASTPGTAGESPPPQPTQ